MDKKLIDTETVSYYYVTGISVGYQQSCAVLDNASIKCWGRNENGQLGIDNDTVMGDGAGEMAILP